MGDGPIKNKPSNSLGLGLDPRNEYLGMNPETERKIDKATKVM